MTKKIFHSILTVSLVALLACLIIVMGVFYQYLSSIQKDRMRSSLDLAAAGVERDGAGYLGGVDTDSYRLTWIDGDGSVLFDSKADASGMGNHADREEVGEALVSGHGESERYSDTLTVKTLYCATRLSDGTVLRISTENLTVVVILAGMFQPLAIVLLIVLILAGILASRMAKRIVRPLNELDLEHPLEAEAYDELAPLLRRINLLHSQVDGQIRELRRKKDEFNLITGSMNEGLVLLDARGKVVSMNRAAQSLFGTDASCIGGDFLTVDRRRETFEAIQAAEKNGHSELRTERQGREYQFEIDRILSDGEGIGIALLAFDMTEKVFAERNRREFTANVSHELKTPLQSIMGSAELMENGLVKPEDVPRFVGHIRTEAARLVALIEDIIRLSQLDEGREMPFESVDLLELANETKGELRYAADSRKVAFRVTGEETVICGVRKLLAEVVFNLCDNAIKYNREGGSVDVSVTHDKEHAILTVRDTGIGIPPEHRERVFERFYRVDKSHSKESGGTGLGLSIVKHAVQLHHGTVALTGNQGEGSVFTVTLPIKQTEA